MGTRLQDLKLQLKIGTGGVRMVGIWGIGGGGKTTLASSLYNEISGKFDSCCFLENIKEESSIKTLQEKILSTILNIEMKVDSVDKGKHLIKTRLGRKNVLLILDDIDDHNQLESLAGSHDWFGDGSRIIITTRDEHLLRIHRVDGVSHVCLLSDEEANRLFDLCAYNKNNFVEEYKMLSQSVVSYASGLPLAIKIIGKFLYDKNKDEWISVLNRLKGNPEMKIVEKLKISYDGLTPLEKELFLDIACFWRGRDKDEAMAVLDACGFHPRIGVKVLIQKNLITTLSKGRYSYKHDVFEMHDLIQEMGQYIVRGEHPNNPEKHSRLWQDKEIEDMCCNGNATAENNRTEAIVISNCPSTGYGKLLSKAKKLRLLYVNNYYLNEGDIEEPEYLSNELRYMYWSDYPANSFPESFQARKLVVLRLEDTWQKELWKGNKYLPCLKELYLERARNLVRTSDFGRLPSLEKLVIKDCYKLKRIEGNFHASKHLHKCVIIGYYREPIKLPKDLFHEHIHLEELQLEFTRLPCDFYFPRFIRRLTLSRFGLKDGEIPSDIGELYNLQELDLSFNGFSVINFSLLRLTRLKLLNLNRCRKLVELPKLPTSIAILKADGCESLKEVDVGDIINKNCKWLCQVSLWSNYSSGNRVINGGERLLQTMLQGNAIENGCFRLRLYGVEIPMGFTPRLLRGERYRLELPENWYNHFSGFLICVVVRGHVQDKKFSGFLIVAAMREQLQQIIMEHKKDGTDSQQDVYWDESKYNGEQIWVLYVSFDSLKNTL